MGVLLEAAAGLIVLAATLVIWHFSLPVSDGDDSDSGDDGSDWRWRRGPDGPPPAPPAWWPEFEREFAEHVATLDARQAASTYGTGRHIKRVGAP